MRRDPRNLSSTCEHLDLDSETPSPTDPTAPNLVVLNESGAINLRELCGFAFTEGFWNRKRYIRPFGGDTATLVGVGLLAVLFGAVIGKQLGITRARRKRARLLRELEQRIAG